MTVVAPCYFAMHHVGHEITWTKKIIMANWIPFKTRLSYNLPINVRNEANPSVLVTKMKYYFGGWRLRGKLVSLTGKGAF